MGGGVNRGLGYPPVAPRQFSHGPSPCWRDQPPPRLHRDMRHFNSSKSSGSNRCDRRRILWVGDHSHLISEELTLHVRGMSSYARCTRISMYELHWKMWGTTGPGRRSKAQVTMTVCRGRGEECVCVRMGGHLFKMCSPGVTQSHGKREVFLRVLPQSWTLEWIYFLQSKYSWEDRKNWSSNCKQSLLVSTVFFLYMLLVTLYLTNKGNKKPIKVGATHFPGSQLSQLIKLKTLPVYYQVVAECLDASVDKDVIITSELGHRHSQLELKRNRINSGSFFLSSCHS